MPQCMGQCGRTLWKAPLQLEWIYSASWCLIINTVNQSLVERPVKDTELEWETSRGPPAIGHIRVTSCESSSPSSPCRAQEQGNPEHRPPRSHGFSRTFASQRITVTWQVSERHCQRVGSSFRRRKTNCTFYILHYMWLCTICWYPDDGVHVWNIWYLAFSRRHEMKWNV